MTSFQPELGQAVFSTTPWQEFEASELLVAVLHAIGDEVARVQGNVTQEPCYPPTDNIGGEEFVCDTFSMRSYCWCDGGRHPEGCPPNFAWKDLRVNWYKHASRGTSCNRDVTPDECAEILTSCLAACREMDAEYWRKLGLE